MLLTRYGPERSWTWQHLGHVTEGWQWCHEDDLSSFDQGQPLFLTSAHSFLAIGIIPAFGWATEAKRIRGAGFQPVGHYVNISVKSSPVGLAPTAVAQESLSGHLNSIEWSEISYRKLMWMSSSYISRNWLQPKLTKPEFPWEAWCWAVPIVYLSVANPLAMLS